MNITLEEFEKSKNNYNKYRRLMEKNQEVMMRYILDVGSEELPAEYNTPISQLGFSVRLLNTLSKSKIRTFGDLCKSSPMDLYQLRNFGKKNLMEMREFLDSKGIKWGEF